MDDSEGVRRVRNFTAADCLCDVVFEVDVLLQRYSNQTAY
ncbi:hypothetical protein DSUL_50075 [Desulfovibrionales bacterium]